MSRSFVRSSKYRHVFGTPFKRENCYDNIRITKSPHDSNMCTVNGKFVAVVLEAQGGGSFLVAPLSKTGRFDINYPKVAGHKGLVMDISWNPFNDNEIASSSEDCTVKIWDIPDGGITENLTEAKQTLQGHSRKVGHVNWHPAAENILASVGFDHNIIIWNTVTAEELFTIKGVHTDIIYCMSWSYDGSLLATTCKDKKIRVIDPRKEEVVSEGSSHVGTKPSRVIFCGTTNKLFTTGFTRTSERQYGVWNPVNLASALQMENIDSSSGVLFPFWDEGTKMVYIVGKGDTQIKYFELTDSAPYAFFLSMYQSTVPQRGVGLMPKRHLDYMHCEVMRFYKLTKKDMVEPISMTVPRKSEMFQDDIFPPTFSGIAALTAEEWTSGVNKDPRLIAFSRDGLSDLSAKESQVSKPVLKAAASADRPPIVKRQSSGSVGSRSSSKEGTPPREPQTLDEYKHAYRELLQENERLKKQLAEQGGRSSYKRF